MSKSTALVLVPTLSRADMANARAYALGMQYNVGVRGALPYWAINAWINALRPTFNAETSDNVGGTSTPMEAVITVDGESRAISRADYRHTRAWANENGIAVGTRGVVHASIVQKWVDAGMPVNKVVIATVYYVKMNVVTKTPGTKEHIAYVYEGDITGTPRPADYWSAVNVDNGIPVRIETNKRVIDVARFASGELSYRVRR